MLTVMLAAALTLAQGPIPPLPARADARHPAATRPTPAEYQACNGQATIRVTMSPSPAPASTPGGAPIVPPASPPVVSPPGAPGAGATFSDPELLEQADPRYRDNPVFRKVFLDCLGRLGY